MPGGNNDNVARDKLIVAFRGGLENHYTLEHLFILKFFD